MPSDAASLQGRLKTRLELVREELEEALNRLKDQDLTWAPVAGMRTIGGQLLEIVTTEMQVISMIRDGVRLSQDKVIARVVASTVTEYRDLLVLVRAETLAYIEALGDAELDACVPMPKNWYESLLLDETPRSEAIRSIAQHEWYHVGQLYSYLWMRGDNPYTW